MRINSERNPDAEARDASIQSKVAQLMQRIICSISFDRVRLGVGIRRQGAFPSFGRNLGEASYTLVASPKNEKLPAIYYGIPWRPNVHIFIDRIAPTPLIENRKARVYFNVSNMTLRTLDNLWISVTIRPQFFPHGVDDVTEYPGLVSWRIPVLNPFEFFEGVITFVIPPASERGMGEPPPNVLRLTLSQYQEPTQEQADQASAAGYEVFGTMVELTSVSVRFDSGARYRLAVTGIGIKSTASIINDTVLVAVSGSANGQAPPDQGQSLGDHGGSGGRRIAQIPVNLPGIGYFDSVADGNGERFTLSYVVANMGNTGDQENLETALNWISRIAAAVATLATGAQYGALWALLEQFTEWLNSLLKPCNRLVAQGQDSFGADDLFNITFDQEQFDEITPILPPAEYVTKRGGNEGAACETSDYFISRTIFRDRSGIEFIELGDQDPNIKDYALVTFLKYGQKLALNELVNLTPGNLLAGLDGAERKWEIEYGGGTINKGTFIAPPGPTPLSPTEFAVVTLQMLIGGIEKGHGFIVIRFT